MDRKLKLTMKRFPLAMGMCVAFSGLGQTPVTLKAGTSDEIVNVTAEWIATFG